LHRIFLNLPVHRPKRKYVKKSKTPACTWERTENFNPKIGSCELQAEFHHPDLHPHLSPFKILKLLLPAEILNIIITESGNYVEQCRRKDRKSFKGWAPFDLSELWVFLGLNILMGIVDKPDNRDYWARDPLLFTPFFGETMPRDRFELILRSLHFTNNEDETNAHSQNKFKKLGNFFPKLLETFNNFITPGAFVCIDESLVKFKGRLSIKQYIPSKRARFGLKFFMLVDCQTKFVVRVLPYEGKETKLDNSISQKDFGFGGSVCVTLMKGLFNKCRRLVVDNFFSSRTLASYLVNLSTGLLGTVKLNRTNMPKVHPEKFVKGKPKWEAGEVAVYSNESMQVVR